MSNYVYLAVKGVKHNLLYQNVEKVKNKKDFKRQKKHFELELN